MTLQFIFDELCKGNLSVLTLEAYEFIGNETIRLLNILSTNLAKNVPFIEKDVNDAKVLLMIANLTYNRTGIEMLPMDDFSYDNLINMYKKIDPNFQVGSVVVTFQEQVKAEMVSRGETGPVEVLDFYTKPERDEITEHYHHMLTSFDVGRYNYHDVFDQKPSLTYSGTSISKRTHNTKHNHPELVGTLDKAKFVLDADAIEKDVYDHPATTILERDFFLKHIRMGLYPADRVLEMVMELKYDGVSVEGDCTDHVESARTRGDTGIGEASDITPMLYGYPFPRNDVLADREIGVKFEAIMSYFDLQRYNIARGTNYANARTAIIGLFGSSDAHLFRDYITLVPLALDRAQLPEIKNRMEEIELLNKLYMTKGEPLRYCYIRGDYQTCLFLIKKFLEEARYARDYLNFMFDGIVVSYLDEDIRQKLGRENFINKYSMAVKFDPLSRYTTFLGYTFQVGQSGNICPMIHYVPVTFIGTTHPKSTGSSRGRFMKLALKPGDVIEVTYNNDVMPYVTKVDCESNRQNTNPLCEFPTHCPSCGTLLEVSTSGDSARCPNWHCPARTIARLASTFDKLGFTGFAEATVQKLGIKNFADLLSMDREQLVNRLGEASGEELYYMLYDWKSFPMLDYKILSALGFTKIGEATWRKICTATDALQLLDTIEKDPTSFKTTVCSIQGIGESVANTIIAEYPLFKNDIFSIRVLASYWVSSYTMRVADAGSLPYVKQIRFSGCRDAQLINDLSMKGYDISGTASVTKSTDILIVPCEGFISSKTSSVSDTCQIVTLSDFLADPTQYL